jgi:hypothetical protein
MLTRNSIVWRHGSIRRVPRLAAPAFEIRLRSRPPPRMGTVSSREDPTFLVHNNSDVGY